VHPTSTWAAGQVVADEYLIPLPESTPLGAYQLATGLYDAASGEHLHLMSADGLELPDTRLLLPAIVSVSETDD
jgi:hypothetical protein